MGNLVSCFLLAGIGIGIGLGANRLTNRLGKIILFFIAALFIMAGLASLVRQ